MVKYVKRMKSHAHGTIYHQAIIGVGSSDRWFACRHRLFLRRCGRF